MRLVILVYLFILSGCVKEAKVASPLDESNTTRIAFTYSYKAKDLALRSCLLQFDPRDDQGESFLFKLDVEGSNHRIAYVKPGNYKFTSIQCLGIGKVYPDQDHLIAVQSEKINYQGHFYLMTHPERNHIWFNWLLSQAPNGAYVSALRNDLAASVRPLLISGLTGKPITQAMVTYAGSNRRVLFRTNGSNESIQKSLQDKILKCSKDEFDNHPAALGFWKMRAKFKAGSFQGAEVLENENTFGDKLEKCIKDTLANASIDPSISELIIDI